MSCQQTLSIYTTLIIDFSIFFAKYLKFLDRVFTCHHFMLFLHPMPLVTEDKFHIRPGKEESSPTHTEELSMFQAIQFFSICTAYIEKTFQSKIFRFRANKMFAKFKSPPRAFKSLHLRLLRALSAWVRPSSKGNLFCDINYGKTCLLSARTYGRAHMKQNRGVLRT